MIRCGKLCKGCGSGCNKPDDVAYMVACPFCDDAGCDRCGDRGSFSVECPRRYVGDLARFINLAGMCNDGLLPVAGGLLDQSAWFVELHQRLNGEQNRIESESLKDG